MDLIFLFRQIRGGKKKEYSGFDIFIQTNKRKKWEFGRSIFLAFIDIEKS